MQADKKHARVDAFFPLKKGNEPLELTMREKYVYGYATLTTRSKYDKRMLNLSPWDLGATL